VNFAIDAAFREAGIEIPFPQRDLHVRTGLAPVYREGSRWPDGAGAAGAAE
jgi:small-conductance mechanosensitive channel